MTDRIAVGLVAGRDLDARIAVEVMGWYRNGPRSPVWYRPDGSREHDGAGRWPRYSTDIGDAMEVFEKLGGMVTIRRILLDEWQVSIGAVIRWADTLPLAICRAALACSVYPRPAAVSPSEDRGER